MNKSIVEISALLIIIGAILTSLASTHVSYCEGAWLTLKTISGKYSQTTDDFEIPTDEWRIVWSITPYPNWSGYFWLDASATRAGYTGSIPRVAKIEADPDNRNGIVYASRGDDDYYISISAGNLESYTLKVEYYLASNTNGAPSPGNNDALSGIIGLIFIIGIVMIPILVFRKLRNRNQTNKKPTDKD